MSGSYVSTGMLTNNGRRLSRRDIRKILDLKIEESSILILPLKNNSLLSMARLFGRELIQDYIHPAFSFTLSHIAIQLTLERDYYVIMEYGQYYSEKSEMKNSSIFASFSKSSNSSINPRTEFNNFHYYYINKDGVRLTIIPKQILNIIEQKFNSKFTFERPLSRLVNKRRLYSSLILIILICNHFGISLEQYIEKVENLPSYGDYKFIECDINNKIFLRELCDKFKGKKWEAISYNVKSHNCQDFVCEVIKILKAIRIHDYDKIRSLEKACLPNCIISALWDNEELSALNTIGRIPIIGTIFDAFAKNKIKINYLK